MATLWVTLLGPPGAGKTTVGQCLEQSGHRSLGSVTYLSGSRLLDDYIEAERAGWERLKRRKDEGHIADQELTHKLLGERMPTLSKCGLVLLDGFPKRMEDVERTERLLPNGLDLAVLLDCPSSVRVGRIANRRVCKECGVVSASATSAQFADQCGCGGALSSREDDAPEVLSFRESSEPPQTLAAHFKRSNRLVTIDAGMAIEEVVGTLVSVTEEVSGRVPRKIRDI